MAGRWCPYATNYNGNADPQPGQQSPPGLTKPVIYWNPVIAPGNITFYKGAMFPQWQGSALIGGMVSKTLNRVTFDGKGGATPRRALGCRSPHPRCRGRARWCDMAAGRQHHRRHVPCDAEIESVCWYGCPRGECRADIFLVWALF